MGLGLSSPFAAFGGAAGRGFGLAWGQTKDVGLNQLDGALEIGDTSGLEAVVGAGDEVFDLRLVVLEEGVDAGLVENTGALRLGKDEIEEEEEAEYAYFPCFL